MPLLILLLSAFCEISFAAPDLQIFQAKHGQAAPVVLFVHGGAWISGDKSQYAPLGEKLSQQGLCVVNLNYSLAPAAKHPQPVKELDSAIVELAKKKLEGPCDFNKIYLAGHSAGAHAIAFWGTAYANPAVKGFIGLEGIYDLPKLAKTWPTYPDWFLKKEFGLEPAWAEASPARLALKSKAPWLLIQSLQDELVDAAQSKEFLSHLKANGISATSTELPSGSHDGVIRNLGDAEEASTKALLGFIKK